MKTPKTCLELNLQRKVHDATAILAHPQVDSNIANATFLQSNVSSICTQLIPRRPIDCPVVKNVTLLVKFLESAPIEPLGATGAWKLDVTPFLTSQMN